MGTMIGQEASTLACEYGPQWMNMPNLALRYQLVRSYATPSPCAKGEKAGRQEPARASFRNSRRFGVTALSRGDELRNSGIIIVGSTFLARKHSKCSAVSLLTYALKQ